MMAGVSSTPTGDTQKVIEVSEQRYESEEYVIEEKGLKPMRPIVIANWNQFQSEEEGIFFDNETLERQAQQVVKTLMIKFKIGENKIHKMYNLHKEKLMEALVKEGGNISNGATPDVFICFIITRGLDNFFYDVPANDKQRSSKIYLKEVMEIFNGTRCPGLVLRPKLFFVQTECQRSEKKNNDKFSSQAAEETEVKRLVRSIPVEADFLLYSLTSPDFPAHRLKFIDFICDELKDRQDILSATVKINRKVQKATKDDIENDEKSNENNKYNIEMKLPLCTSQLTKQIIL